MKLCLKYPRLFFLDTVYFVHQHASSAINSLCFNINPIIYTQELCSIGIIDRFNYSVHQKIAQSLCTTILQPYVTVMRFLAKCAEILYMTKASA